MTAIPDSETKSINNNKMGFHVVYCSINAL